MLLIEDKVKKFTELFKENTLYYEGDLDDIEEGNEIYDIADEVFDCCEVNHGVSKVVVIPDNTNYVIKMPITGKVYKTYEKWDEEEQDYVELSEAEVEYEDYDTDYCGVEADIYTCAEEENLSILFAKTEYYGMTKGGLSVYIQEKINIFGDCMDCDSVSHESSSLASSMISDSEKCRRLSSLWLGAVIERYGETMAQALVDFCDENDINDLHDGNIGFRDNGEPVLIDYSGWYEGN